MPPDVIITESQDGLLGVQFWPQYSAREVQNLIDKIEPEYCYDFEGVFILFFKLQF